MAFDFFRFGFAVVFVGVHCALMAGLFLEWLRDRGARRKKAPEASAGESLPRVSVIIPIHNESLRMEGLLKTLRVQDYAGTEFVFIDDRSSDDSAAMIAAFVKGRPLARIVSLKENPGPNRKQFALGKGIAVSSGEFILFTDADCEIPPGWIGAMVRRMSDRKVGAAIGPVFKQSERPGGRGKGFFHLYQCFEHAVRYMYLAGSTGLGAAGGGFGNNLILRRECLDAVGGYEQVPPSPTEDAALVARIRACSDYKVRAAVGPDVHVFTRGENSWKALINQTLRWNNGGLFSPDLSTRLNFGFLMVIISMGILAIPALPFYPPLWPLPAAVMLSMTFNTIAVMGLFGVSLPRKGAAYILQLIFTPMYFTFLTILGFCGVKSDWKGSRL
jgi:cellulose synthase/poly-beta-1,6-N-acetylglucosamine synthase-like glycosyltransferase